MTPEEMNTALDAMLEQGNQLRASELIPLVKALVADAAPIEVTDITKLTNDQLDALEVGSKVVKVTGTEKHLYLVTYKATTGGGICLSYNAAGYGETVSYDRTDDGWAYNSTDVKTYGE